MISVNKLNLIGFTFILSVAVQSNAFAILDPCGRQEAAVQRATRAVIVADNDVDGWTNRYENTANAIDYKRAALAANVNSAQANVNAVNSSITGAGIGCGIAVIFGGSRCVPGVVAGGFNQSGYANAAVQRAQGNYIAYYKASEAQLARAADRVAFAIARRDRAVDLLEVANEALLACRNGDTVTTITTTKGNNSITTTITNGNGSTTGIGSIR